ncbi:hypothetical protein [Stakelama pacifica]|uniref:Uncharacterized protein n=1 Tax=Stakelama pacifica TaxID=517720 RepID=A0A4R6F9M1_9SPHN|nr:hypothetical protein [Stakelama pacifica]TDN77743.1 hypothetical protein EV664_1266 [Stakelama pacifica]GGP00871.1 hypothetical protein GCM10011329_37750 [Stakelama pacifica]
MGEVPFTEIMRAAHPIETAPKDGTTIWVGDEDAGVFWMRWGHIQKNGLFPGQVGMWVAPGGEFTWNDSDGFGPTWWLTDEEYSAVRATPPHHTKGASNG